MISEGIRQFLQKQFRALLLCSFLAGLILPGLEQIPSAIVGVIVAAIIFFSCFQMKFEDLRSMNFSLIAWYYLARFILLPLGLFYATQIILPSLSLAVFLLAALPAGVSSPAFTGILRGNISLALVVVVVSTFLSPFTMPLLLTGVTGQGLSINSVDLFFGLSLTVFTPLLFYAACTKVRTIRQKIEPTAKPLAILLTLVTIVLIIGKERTTILSNPQQLALHILVASLTFFVLYLVGWQLGLNQERKEKISFALCSGVNNTGLGMSIALLYFPAEVALFMVVAEIPWTLMIIPFKTLIDRLETKRIADK